MNKQTLFYASLPEAFAQAAMAFPNKEVVPGQMLRFSTNGKPTNTAGWLKLFDDGVGAVFGCKREGTSFVWQQRDHNAPPPSQQERNAFQKRVKEARKEAEAVQAIEYAEAARKATLLWHEAGALDVAHPYLVRKGITPYGARKNKNGSVMLPVYGSDDGLQSLQFIDENGKKRSLYQGKMKGGRLFIGEPANGAPLILAEGWATSCSLHETTGCTVVVAFSGANLEHVAAELRVQFPNSALQVAADLDEHGAGLRYAQAAANAGVGAVVLPAFADGRASGDFNDLHQAEGLGAVRRQVRTQELISPLAAHHESAYFLAPTLPKTDARDGTATTRSLTEYGNAQRLFDINGERLKYVAQTGRWLVWQDAAWAWNDGSAIRSMAAQLPDAIYAEGAQHLNDAEYFAKWARKSQEHRTIQASVALLSDLPGVRLSLACVDADPFTVGLNQARQIIDLHTGVTRDTRPGDYVTKSLNVDTGGDAAKAVRWQQFMDQVFEGDQALINWLQRFCGYLLTGSTQEQIFLFCFGHGANGKSVFAEVLKYIMGDYGRALASETLSEGVIPPQKSGLQR